MHDPYQQQVQITVHKESWWSVKLAKQTNNKTSIHCKRGIVIATDSLLFQTQMSEKKLLLCGGELHDNLFLILSQLSSTLSYHLGN